jgi:hypothetical protein
MTERSFGIEAIDRLERAQLFELFASDTSVQCRVPVMVHLVGRVRLEPDGYHGQLAEHPGERRLFPQRRRHSKHSFGEVWNIREREEDVFRIRSALPDQTVVQIGPAVRHGLSADIGNARHVSH